MIRRLVPATAILLALTPGVVLGQKTGVAVTPFFGLTVPGKLLLLRPGLDPSVQAEKQAVLGLVGGRINIGLTQSLEFQGDLGYGSSGLKVASLAAPSGTIASVLTMSGELVYRNKPAIEPFSLTLHGGVGAVHRSFSENTGTMTSLRAKTNIGAVLGAGFNFRASRRTAVVVGIDDFIYNATFTLGTGTQTAGTTQPLTQNDVRVTLGFRVAIAGQ